MFGRQNRLLTKCRKTNDGEFISSYECDPRQQMRNFCFPNGSISILPADSRRTISSHTRYASPLSREKSLRKKRTRSAMKQRCDGQRENTLSLLRPTSTNLTFTTISFIILPRWMPYGNSKLLFFRSGGAKTQRYGLPGTRAVHYYTEAVSGASEKNCLS